MLSTNSKTLKNIRDYFIFAYKNKLSPVSKECKWNANKLFQTDCGVRKYDKL